MSLQKIPKLDEVLFWAKVFVEEINDAVIILDASSDVLWWNSLAGNLFGLNNSDHLGAKIPEVIAQADFIQYFEEKGGGSVEIPSPVYADVLLSLMLIPSGDLLLLVAQDISSRQHVDRMRRDFVANVSHEMRTPLTVVQGYLEMMQADISGAFPAWGESISQMISQMGRLEDLLDDLLLLASLENNEGGDSTFNLINVSALVPSLVQDVKALSNDNHRLLLDVDSDVYIRGSLKELNSCFGNLLANAVRYSPDGGSIKLSLKSSKDTKVVFCVEDEGIGIEKKHIPRLTERFYRVDKGRSRDTGGTGLGLSIARHVLLRHGADLTIESTIGSGSVFTCVFPLSS